MNSFPKTYDNDGIESLLGFVAVFLICFLFLFSCQEDAEFHSINGVTQTK